jgi:acetolactate synthase-1/2/3 large subunit
LSDAHYDVLAQALGCYGERITQPAQIRPALQRAVDSGLPSVLDVTVDTDVHLVPPDLELLDGLWMEGCDVAGEG